MAVVLLLEGSEDQLGLSVAGLLLIGAALAAFVVAGRSDRDRP